MSLHNSRYEDNQNPQGEEMVNPEEIHLIEDNQGNPQNDPYEKQNTFKKDGDEENLIQNTQGQVKDIEMEQLILPATQVQPQAVNKLTQAILQQAPQESTRRQVNQARQAKKGQEKQQNASKVGNESSKDLGKDVSKEAKKSKTEKKKDMEKQFKMSQKKHEEEDKLSCWNRYKQDNLFLRKSWRILLLLIVVFVIVGLINLFYYSIGFIRGNETIQNNQKIKLSIQSCTLSIYDYSLLSTELIDYNFLGTTDVPSSLDDSNNAYFNFIYPDAPGLSKVSSFTKSEENGETTYSILNEFSSQSCEAIIFLYKQTTFDSFQIDCGSTSQCNIIINSSLATFTDLNIYGFDVQMNAPELTATNFNYKSSKGHIEIPNFTFSTAKIITREGDIAVQSTNGIKLTTYQKDPFICLSSAGTITQLNSATDYTDTTFKSQFSAVSSDCKSVYPYGGAESDDTLIEKRCMKGEQQLNSNGSAPQVLEAQNSFGNIYVNVITSKGSIPKEQSSTNNVILYNKIRVGESTDLNVQSYINLSEQSNNNLVNSTKTAANPKVYDPVFLYYFGPQYTRSDSSQQVQVSYNPAYSYMRPWWLGTLTVTLMTTELYKGQYTIAPGFCPYIPSINLDRMYKTQQLVRNFMVSNSAPATLLVSNAWSYDIPKPHQDFDSTNSYSGFRTISEQRLHQDQWLGIYQDEQKIFSVTNFDVNENGSLLAAIIVSCVLSGIMAILFMVLLVYAINLNYRWVLDHIASVSKYSTLEKNGKSEIDETTLGFEKRNLYNEYQETMKQMEEQDKQNNSAHDKEENQETDYVPKYTVTGIFKLFSQLIYKSPPLSAFIDYIVLLFHKAKQNSIEEFYKLLFIEKKYDLKKGEEVNVEEEVHNLDKDSISGKELKSLYEKYCYLNQYLERKFDDENNIKLLKRRGFKIIFKQDSQTQFFTRVKFNGTIAAVSEVPGKTSLDLFFSSSCSLTNFETDQIEASVLEKNYSEFCSMNHMTKLQFNEALMKKDFGIESTYVPEQSLERDDKFDVQVQKKKYFIDKNRVENNFKIILAKNLFLFNLIYDSKEIRQAQRDIQVPTGWQFFDFITVIAHIITMIALGSPLLIIVVFIRIQQTAYSLYSPQHLIYFETLLYYPTSIPAKLIDDSWLIKFVVILTLAFWCLSFLDLIYYYASMGFPQERYFNEYNQTAQRFRKILTSIMWVIVLFALYALVMYVSLVAIWLMLGAIINPNAFLPYATSAATFVTLVTKKYKEFQEIYQNGFKTLADYLENLASEQFQDLLGKMNIQETIADMVPTESIKSITAEASKLGIIDASVSEEIQNNLEVMIRDPTAATKLGSELVKISQDPGAFAAQVTQKLEEKAKQLLSQQIHSIDKEVKEQIINLLWCLLKNQKSEMKQAMNLFVNSLIAQFQKKKGSNLAQSIGFVNLKGPVFDFIWEFAFPQENIKIDYSDHITDVFCAALSNIITVWNKQMKTILIEPVKQEVKKQEKQAQKSKGKKETNKKPEDILRERIQAELKRAEAAILIDEGADEDQLVMLSSDEQIAFAYKNIIFSVIKICKAINTGSSEEILDQIILLGEHTSKLPGFESFALVKKFQDVFQLGFSVFKNSGEISASDITEAIKGFIKNSGFDREVKEIAGVGVLDILKVIEIIIESFKNQSKSLNLQTVKKTVLSLIENLSQANTRSLLMQADFDVDTVERQQDCDKIKGDLKKSIEDITKQNVELEQQIARLKEQEAYSKEKQDDCLYYARANYQEAIEYMDFPKKNEILSKIDSIDGEELVKLIKSARDISKKQLADKEKEVNTQKDTLDKKFIDLCSKKKTLLEEIENAQIVIDEIEGDIAKVVIIAEKDFEKIKTSCEDTIQQQEQSLKTNKAQSKSLAAQVKEAQKKLNDFEKLRNPQASFKDEEEEHLLLENIDGESDQDNSISVPKEGLVNRLLQNEMPSRDLNMSNFDTNKDFFKTMENKGKSAEEIDTFKDVANFRKRIFELKSQIESASNQIRTAKLALEKAEAECERIINNKKQSSQIAKREEEMEVLQQQKEKLINEISEVMNNREELENDDDSTEAMVHQDLEVAHERAEEYKDMVKQFTRVLEEKISLRNTLTAAKEQKEKYESVLKKIEERSNEIAEQQSQIDDSKKEKKGKEEKVITPETLNSYFATGVTLMLNFFTGQLMNIPIEMIREFGLLLTQLEKTIKSKAITKLKELIISESEQKTKGVGQSKDRLLNFQSLINLIEIFLNDSMISVQKIEQNGLDQNIDTKIVKPLTIFFTLKFNGLVKQSQINQDLKGSDLLDNLEAELKIKQDVIIGLMEIIAGYKQSKEINNFINFAATQNKISESKVPTIHHIYNIYSSTDPSELYSALEYFMVADEPQKDMEDVTLRDLVKVMLFMRGQIEFSFVKSILEDKLKLVLEEQKDESPKYQILIKDLLKNNKTIPVHWKRLLEIENSSYLTITALTSDFKDFNRDKSIILEGSDLKFIKKFISLRNIPRVEDTSQSTIVKSSIQDISEILNISNFALENFITLFTSNKEEKLLKTLQTLSLEKLDPQLKQKNLKNFIEYSTTIQNKLEARSANIKQINKLIFQNSIPLALLNKVLDNNNYELTYADYIQIFTVNCSNEIPKSISHFIDFRFGLSGSSTTDIYNFINLLESDKSEEKYSKFQEEKYGLMKVIQIISIDDESRRLKVFLQHLINKGQHVLLLMSCFLVYFSGRSSNMMLSIPEKGEIGPVQKGEKKKKVSVEQLIGQILQIKSEFFESIHTVFQEDTVVCTRTLIKFFRQLDYLDQTSESKQIIVENNITVSEKTVEQYLRLVSGKSINTSFFAKESNIPIELIELLSCLQQIQKSNSSEERQTAFQELKNNQVIGRILSQLQVNPQELIVLLTFMYQDYDPTKVKWISQSLRLPSRFPIDGLSQFIMLDQTLHVYGDPKTNKKTLEDRIKLNKFVKNFKFDKNWVAVAYLLTKGDFTLLPEYKSKILALRYPNFGVEQFLEESEQLNDARTLSECVNADHDRYLDLIQGITGLLSCRQKSIQPTKFFHQLYTKLNQTFWKEEGITIDDGLRKGNTLDYAIYKFTKATQISPLWTLLMMGDYHTWELLAQNHFLVNRGYIKTTNPFLALVYVLCFRNCPIIVKQLLVDYEYAKPENQKMQYEDVGMAILDNLLDKDDPKKKRKRVNKSETKKPQVTHKFDNNEKDEIVALQNKIKDLKEKIENYLNQIIICDNQKLIEISESIGFPKRIINMLTIYNTEHELKIRRQEHGADFNEEDYEGWEAEVYLYDIFNEAKQIPQSENTYDALGLLNQLFAEFDTAFYTDPRREKFDENKKAKIAKDINHIEFTSEACLQTFVRSSIMQMTMLSTISQLKGSYSNFYGLDDREEMHYKSVTNAIELLLSTLERFYYFSDMMEFFPKHRLFPLIGLSVGFLLESDDIINAVTSRSVYDGDYQDKVIRPTCQELYNIIKDQDEDTKITKEQEIELIEAMKFKKKMEFCEENLMSQILQIDNENTYIKVYFRVLEIEDIQDLLEEEGFYTLNYNYHYYVDEMNVNSYTCLQIPDTQESSDVVRSDYYYAKYQFDELDVYTGEIIKGVFEKLDDYDELSHSENFRVLIDVFKENYQMLNQNEYFTSQYQQESNFFFGLLLVNGCMAQSRGNIKPDEFQSAISACSHYLSSNKKALSEILSLLLPSLPISFSSAFEQYSPPEEATPSFMNLCLGKSEDENKDLDRLLKKSSLSFDNKLVLKNTIWAHLGDMNQHMQLLLYSGLDKTSSVASSFFKRFLWSFEKSEMHTQSNNPYEINYFDFCNLSPNRTKALKEAQTYLWSVSTTYFYEKYLQALPKDEKKLELKEYISTKVFKNNEIEEESVANLLQNILYSDWNFLQEKETKSLKPAFDFIFQSEKQHQALDTLKFLALLKPEKCNLKIESQSQYYDLINPQSIEEFYKIASANNFKIFNSIDEQRSISLLFSLTNNSLLSTLNGLNTGNQEWILDQKLIQEDERIEKELEDFKTELEKVGGDEIDYKCLTKYLALQQETKEKIKEELKQEDNNSENYQGQKIGLSLQSLYVWKNLQYIDWSIVKLNRKKLFKHPIEQREMINEFNILNQLPQLLKNVPSTFLEPDYVFNRENISDIEYRTLDPIFFELNSKKKQNSIYNIMFSFINLTRINSSWKDFQDSSKKRQEYDSDEDEYQSQDENKNKEDDQDDASLLTSFMNGSFFLSDFISENSSTGKLISYLANLYFIGNRCLHNGSSERIIKFLFEDGKEEIESSFIKPILKEEKYINLFNQVVGTLFSIYFGSKSGTGLSKDQKDAIIKQIDELIQTVSLEILQIDQNIIDLVYAVFYLITNEELPSIQNKDLKDKQKCLVIAFEHPDLSEFFFGAQKSGAEAAESIEKMISTISGILQSILEKPYQSINDPDLIKEVLKLVKYAGKGTIDVSIIDDLFSVLNGEHKKVFSIMKKFELMDENKIQSIEKAYVQVQDMPIFKAVTSKINGAVGGDSKNADKMKEIVKKLKEGKATIQDVFLAVDNEGDSSGAISIDEFQSFVRRLGMELTRHRVNEIFAFIKNKKQVAVSAAQKSEELQLNCEEFEKAFKYVNEKKTSMSLEKLGISPALLALALGTLIIILILLFVFIFLGINAFAVGGTFGSIINSIIPMVAAGGAAGSQENKQDKLKEEEISNVASETQAIIHSDQL